MTRHLLYEVNLERKTAFCTACGYTEIYLPKTRTQTKPRIICINRARELWLDNQARQKHVREVKRQQPEWKPRHTLTEVNPETLRATCAVCGRTDIRKTTSRGYSGCVCLTKKRHDRREYGRAHYIARSTNPHALSRIDEENKTAVCAKCGFVKIEIWHGKKKINRRCINLRNELKQSQIKRENTSGKLEP
jgi:hypothetical protein